MSEYSDDQILTAISNAIAAHDMPAVASLIQVLAVQAPDKAQQIYDAVVHRKITIEVPV
jgi:hypothetical protein